MRRDGEMLYSEPTAVLQLPQTETAKAECLFPQEKDTLHKVTKGT
jgi:hypothetical protein